MQNGNAPLDHIRELIGERAVFVPISLGEKRPKSPGWQATTFEQMQSTEYQQLLAKVQARGGNIGVLLGENSGDLVAIDIDEDELVDVFLGLNPGLANSLRTRGQRGCQIWLRMSTENYPQRKTDLKFRDGRKFCEWRGGGGCQSVIFGRHPSGTDYQILVDTPALQISFDEIVWPEALMLPWNEHSAEQQKGNVQQPASPPDLRKRILAYLDAIPGAVSGNGGHNQTIKVATALVEGWNLSSEDALGYLRIYNVRCEPPWSEKELRHKLNDALKVPHEKPRGHLLEGKSQIAARKTEGSTKDKDDTHPLDFSHYSVIDKPFPESIRPAAFHGIIGQIVQTIQPHTEACREAVLVQLLAALGNVIGRSAYFYAGDSKHHPRLWCTLVGDTSKGRKGSAYSSVERLMREIAPEWVDEHFGTGLSSGEGLIYSVRDPRWGFPQRRTKNLPVEPTEELLDPGVSDKRFFVVEEEFSQVLRHLERKGNTLSEVLRRAWDGKSLRITTKHCPEKSTDPHISVIGHITREELTTCLSKSEAFNGFTNRFLWVASRRQQILPNSGFVPWQAHPQLIKAMRVILETFSPGNERPMTRDPEAQQLWEQVYERLSAGRPGILGAILGRAESQTLRLSMIYAISDCSALIKRCHLEAALAVWDYCERSVIWIFGTSTGSKMADKILWALQRRTNGMTRTEIQMDVFHRNAVKTDLDRALATLVQSGLAYPTEQSDENGRKSELWKIR